MVASVRAMVAQPLYHIVNTLRREVLRQADSGDLNVSQTIRLVALGAVEVYMQFIHRAMTLAAADGILERTRTVVNAMNEVMLEEERDGARQGRLVHRVKIRLQVEQAKGALKLHHGTEY